ncbi:MAG: DUF1638 domain-containing protein, partial [Desulfobacteraceae bacterium]|nr:DUF1638 domain-containing protein [Desulfobacteraceae bacterium]
MGKSKTVYFIGCAVLGPDIFNIADKLNIKLKKKLLPGGLHNRPNELRKRLQEAIDKAGQDSSASRIIIGYGLCGKGTVGIRSPGIPLVFPKVQDCIALFMGSDQEYKKEFAKFPGTFYISGGWFQEKLKEDKSDQIWVGEKSMGARQITDQYGEESGKRIIDFFTSWRKLYQRAAFIDTGIGKASLYEKHAKKMAREYDWQYQRIAGDLSLMTKLLTATRSDDQILVVPPSYVTVYSAQSFGLSAASPAEAKDGKVPLDRILVLDKASHKGLSIKYGLGIDAGGTYTDAAVYDFKNKALSAKNKSLTTKWDFSIGI